MRGHDLRHFDKISRQINRQEITKTSREKPMPGRGLSLMAVTALVVAMTATTAQAQKKYDPGASDTEIKIGNIMPYSGPASSYGVIGKAEAAYFNKINAEG